MSLFEQQERALANAAACAERRSYALSMAAVVKSLTSAEPATDLETAAVKAAEAESREAIKALRITSAATDAASLRVRKPRASKRGS
jgi:hypothetical protein